MEQEEGKLGNEVVQEKRLKYAKKASIHFVSKGRGVSENKEDRALVKGTSDSTNVFPFSRSGTPRITTLIVPFFRYLSFLQNSPKHSCISYNFQSHSDMAARLRHNPTCHSCVVAVS
jgi:hypothetical protein